MSHLDSVCQPGMSSASVDFNAPCNVWTYLLLACAYGQKIPVDKFGLEMPKGPMQSNSSQRLCVCESQYWAAAQGCSDCYKAHGAGEDVGLALPHTLISSMSSSYCAATATPTLGLVEFQASFVEKPQFKSLFSSNTAKPTSTFSDPIGNKTAVSLYYTGLATGSTALNIGEFTGTVSPTTTNVEKGQIVPTATSTKAPNTAKTTATGKATLVATGRQNTSAVTSTTSTGGTGARQTEAALAGVLGLVGVVAML